TAGSVVCIDVPAGLLLPERDQAVVLALTPTTGEDHAVGDRLRGSRVWRACRWRTAGGDHGFGLRLDGVGVTLDGITVLAQHSELLGGCDVCERPGLLIRRFGERLFAAHHRGYGEDQHDGGCDGESESAQHERP